MWGYEKDSAFIMQQNNKPEDKQKLTPSIYPLLWFKYNKTSTLLVYYMNFKKKSSIAVLINNKVIHKELSIGTNTNHIISLNHKSELFIDDIKLIGLQQIEIIEELNILGTKYLAFASTGTLNQLAVTQNNLIKKLISQQ